MIDNPLQKSLAPSALALTTNGWLFIKPSIDARYIDAQYIDEKIVVKALTYVKMNI